MSSVSVFMRDGFSDRCKSVSLSNVLFSSSSLELNPIQISGCSEFIDYIFLGQNVFVFNDFGKVKKKIYSW